MRIVELVQQALATQSSQSVHPTEQEIVITALKRQVRAATHEQVLTTGILEVPGQKKRSIYNHTKL